MLISTLSRGCVSKTGISDSSPSISFGVEFELSIFSTLVLSMQNLDKTFDKFIDNLSFLFNGRRVFRLSTTSESGEVVDYLLSYLILSLTSPLQNNHS